MNIKLVFNHSTIDNSPWAIAENNTMSLKNLILLFRFCFVVIICWSLISSFILREGTFKIEHENGRLLLMKSLDREKKDVYHLKVKAENVIHRRLGRRDINALYQHLATAESHNNHLAYDEALVVVHVLDENDNSPIFENKDRPIVAAVPLEASFGFKVVKATVCWFRIWFVIFDLLLSVFIFYSIGQRFWYWIEQCHSLWASFSGRWFSF